MSSIHEAINLKQELIDNELGKKYYEVEDAFKELQRKYASLERDFEKSKSEKEEDSIIKQQLQDEIHKIKSRVASMEEAAQNEFEEKNNLRTNLIQEKARTTKLLKEKDSFLQKETEYMLAESHMKSEICKLKLTVEDLQATIKDKEVNENSVRSKYCALEKEYEQLKFTTNNKIGRLQVATSNLEAEKARTVDQLHKAASELSSTKDVLAQTKNELEATKSEKEELQLRFSRLEHSYLSLKKNHDLYFEQRDKAMSENEEQTQKFIMQITQLKQQVKQLENQSQEDKDVFRAQFKHVTGMDIVPPGPYNESGSHLLALINEYQKTGKYPEDIYKDFFEIRQKYCMVLAKVEHSTTVAANLTHELNSKEALFDQLSKDLESCKEQLKMCQQSCEEREAKCREVSEHLEEMKVKFSKMTAEKARLEDTLHDTTYQLQYLLFDVQKRGDPIPMPVKKSAKVLLSEFFPPAPKLPHDDLVFRNAVELVDLNRRLTEKMYILDNELSTAKNTIISIEEENNSEALAKAENRVSELEKQIVDKHTQVELLEQELKKQKNLIEEKGLINGSNHAFELCLTQLKETSESYASYRSETLVEIDKLKQELQTSRNSESEIRRNLVSLKAEIIYLKQKAETLSDTVRQREQELNVERQQNSVISNHLATKDKEIEEIKNSLIEYDMKFKQLQNENSDLQFQVKFKTESYDRLKMEVNNSSSDSLRLSTLLESINSRINGIHSVSTESTEVYKDKTDQLSSDLQSCCNAVKLLEKQLELVKSSNYQGIEDKYKEAQGQVQLLKERSLELERKVYTIMEEKIVAETKLSQAEDNLKKMNNNGAFSTGANSNNKSTCDEHDELISELKVRVRVLEDEKDEYASIVEDHIKKANSSSNEHKEYAEKANSEIERLKSDLAARNDMVSKSQEIAQKAKEEYDALREKLQSTQDELTAENATLKSDKTRLEIEVEEKRKQVEQLNSSVEEQKHALNESQEKALEEEKAREKAEETTNKFREVVTKLEKELDSSKQQLEGVKAELESINECYKSESAKWSEFQESIKKSHEVAEKNRIVIDGHLETLFDKLAKWNETVKESTDLEISDLTSEIYTKLKQVNTALRCEKEASELKYIHESKRCRLVEEELNNAKYQLELTHKTIKELEMVSDNLSQNDSAEISRYKLEVDTFRSQNIMLLENNNQLKARIEKLETELSDKMKEMEPLSFKIAALESQLQNAQKKITTFTTKEKEWSARSAEILSKYNQVDPKEVERTKREYEAAKTELEATTAELQSLRSSVSPLNEKIKALEADLDSTRSNQAALVSNANQRQRFAMELKNRLVDANKKNTELESTVVQLQKQIKEGSTDVSKAAIPDVQKVKSLEEALKKEQEARQMAEQGVKNFESSLKKKAEEYSTLETKYAGILNRARIIQAEKNKVSEELKVLKAEQENNTRNKEASGNGADTTETTALKEKIAELEAEVERLSQELQEANIEIGRLKVKNSMMQNKNKRLQDELNAIKNAASEAAIAAEPTTPVQNVTENIAETITEHVVESTIEQSTNHLTEEPVDQPANQLAEQPVEQPAEAAEQPAELAEPAEPAEQPAEQPAESVEPIESAESTKPVEPIEPVEQALEKNEETATPTSSVLGTTIEEMPEAEYTQLTKAEDETSAVSKSKRERTEDSEPGSPCKKNKSL
ncbi:hypothetical protein G6F43_002233 [Rhizopus delemar]|nr:hypothetical protein G6F43_002233 [Rhizopus delemar]